MSKLCNKYYQYLRMEDLKLPGFIKHQKNTMNLYKKLIPWKYMKNSPIRGWGGLSKMSQKVQNVHNWLSQLGQDLFDFSDLTWAHQLSHPSTHRGVSVQIINLQTKLNYIDYFKLY